MSPYQFQEIFEDEAVTDFDLWLFHETKHATLQSPVGWRTFVIKKKESIVALVRFHVEGKIARASVRSPFGTIQYVQDLPAEILFSFIQFFDDELRKDGVEVIELKSPPVLYAPHQNEILSVLLLNNGYQIINAEIGAVIQVDNAFEEKLDAWELRKLRQAEESGLSIQQWQIEKLEEVYNFILECRVEREQSLSMTYEALAEVVYLFPDRFVLHVILDNEKIAAASIGIKINKQILYNFYSAHPKAYDHLSPAVLLIKSMYAFCKANKINLFDLGTSALDGIPNFGLLDFKLRLGANPSAKYTFQKYLQ